MRSVKMPPRAGRVSGAERRPLEDPDKMRERMTGKPGEKRTRLPHSGPGVSLTEGGMGKIRGGSEGIDRFSLDKKDRQDPRSSDLLKDSRPGSLGGSGKILLFDKGKDIKLKPARTSEKKPEPKRPRKINSSEKIKALRQKAVERLRASRIKAVWDSVLEIPRKLHAEGKHILAAIVSFPPFLLLIGTAKLIGEALARNMDTGFGNGALVPAEGRVEAGNVGKVPERTPSRDLINGPTTMFRKTEPWNSELEPVLESQATEEIRKAPKGSDLEIYLESEISEAKIGAWRADAYSKGIRLKITDLDRNTSILIEKNSKNEMVAITTDPYLASKAPNEITLHAEIRAPEQLSQQVKRLTQMGVKKLVLHSDQEISREQAALTAKEALVGDAQLQLRGPGGALMAEVRLGIRGLKVKINGSDYSKTTPELLEAIGDLTRTALWSGAESLTVGKGVINLHRDLKTKKYQLQTDLPFNELIPIFSEYLAFNSARDFGIARFNSDAEHLAYFYRKAMEHVWDIGQHTKNDLRGEFNDYFKGDRWMDKWEGLAMIVGYLGKDPHTQGPFLKTLDLLFSHSQPVAGELLGIRGFDGYAYADNALELVRLLENILPKNFRVISEEVINQNIAGQLNEINQILGDFKNVEMNGAVVGMVLKMNHSNNDAVDAQGRTIKNKGGKKKNTPAHNEYNHLTQMKVAARLLPGRYRFTVLPEDRHYGKKTATKTKTPEWIVEELGPHGEANKILTVEVTQKTTDSIHLTDINKIFSEKLPQVLFHKWAPKVKQRDSLIIIKIGSHKNSTQRAEIIEWAKSALESFYQSEDFHAEGLKENTDGSVNHTRKARIVKNREAMKHTRVQLVFDSIKVNGKAQVVELAFDGKTWTEVESTDYFPESWGKAGTGE